MREETMKPEILRSRAFEWAGECWKAVLPASRGEKLQLYLCRQLDKKTCMRWKEQAESRPVPPEEMTADQLERRMAESPYRFGFSVSLHAGTEVCFMSGLAYHWYIPWEETDEEDAELAKRLGLNEYEGWLIARAFEKDSAFAALNLAKIPLEIILSADPRPVLGRRFENVREAGQTFSFVNPVTGTEHSLNVEDYRDISFRGREDSPVQYFKSMGCSIVPPPDPESFTLYDCGRLSQGDVGGIFLDMGEYKKKDLFYVMSNPYPAPPEELAWRVKFYEKTREDLTVALQ